MRKLIVLTLPAVVLVLGVLAAGASGAKPVESCIGLTPTMAGTQGADVINGPPGADVISARGGERPGHRRRR